MKKGQTVLEFLFLVMIVIIYLTTLVVPMAKDAQTALTDTEKIARANNETQKLANAIQKVSILGDGTRQTVDLFIPEDTTIYCASNNVSFTTTLSLKPYPAMQNATAQCNATNGICTKTFPKQSTSPQYTCITPSFSGPAKTSIKVEKTSSSINIGS